MKTISSKNVITKMDKNNKPVYHMNSNESIIVETLDCFGNKFYGATKDFDKIKGFNPATGPIYINEAKAGDTLKITIENIALANKGVIEFRNKSGLLGNRVKEFDYKIVSMDAEYAYFDNLKIPLKPMIGVIGVAPPEGAISTITPGNHGGNLDSNEIKIGSILYLSVFHDGALLSLGDMHGLMGDGEIGNCGLETYGSAQLKVEVLKDLKIRNPLVIANERLYTLASNISLDEAILEASNDLLDILIQYEGQNELAALRILSLVGDVGICQLVNPKKTVKMSIPIKIASNKIFK